MITATKRLRLDVYNGGVMLGLDNQWVVEKALF